jgi:hypothetical protein
LSAHSSKVDLAAATAASVASIGRDVDGLRREAEAMARLVQQVELSGQMREHAQATAPVSALVERFCVLTAQAEAQAAASATNRWVSSPSREVD